MTDFTFLPSTLTVPAGEEITLTLTNSGAVAHDLMIMKLGQEISNHGQVRPEEQANVFWEQELLEAGETIKSTFTAPTEPGEYQIVCGVAGHLEAGMQGRLIVVESP
jgi:plastocyanin